MAKVNLIDMNFKRLPINKKREAFVLMDATLKVLHSRDYMVTDFNAQKIYFEDGIYFFEDVVPMSKRFCETKEEGIYQNILGLSNLAFCSYLPDYRLEFGPLNYEVINSNFDKFSSCFLDEDVDYYKSVLVDGYNQKKLPADPYYTDYVIQKSKNNTDGGINNVYMKATEAGKAFATYDEAAFGHNFFFITVISSVLVLLIGFIAYFTVYLG